MNEITRELYIDDCTIEALLLQFSEDIVEGFRIPKGFCIPSPHFIGKVLNEIRNGEYHEKVKKGIRESLVRGVAGPEQSQNALETYMFGHPLYDRGVLDWEWIFMYGDWFRVRQDKREKMERRVREYWSPEEMEDFEKIGELLKERVKLEYDGR